MEIEKDLLTVNNFTKGRADRHSGRIWEPDVISIHVTEGSAASADSWFENDASDVSSNYLIKKTGAIKMYVLEEDTSWCNGRVSNPKAQIVLDRPGVNPNLYTISIEHEGNGNEDLTPAQFLSSVWLIRNIASRRPKVQISRRHIIRHNEIYDKKSCPGKIDVDKLVAAALQDLDAPKLVSTVTIPRIVYSAHFGGYLLVTKYVSDSEWYFQPLSSIKGGVKAQTPLSQMPLKP